MKLADYRALAKNANSHNAAHTALVKACLAWLAAHKVPAWKMNTGAAHLAANTATGTMMVRFAFPGCSDILGIIPRGRCSGRFLAIEVKTGKGELSDDQGRFRDTVLAAGGCHIVARSLDDLAQLSAVIGRAPAAAMGSMVNVRGGK